MEAYVLFATATLEMRGDDNKGGGQEEKTNQITREIYFFCLINYGMK